MKKILDTKIKNLKPVLKKCFLEFFNEYSNSVLFWNAILYIIFIITAFINIAFAVCIFSGFGSLFLLVCIADDVESEKMLWAPITMLFWFFVLFGLLIFSGLYMHKKTIVPFNKWLDGLKK